MATWPSGKAEACKAFTPGSNPGVASNFDNRLAKAKRIYADMAQLVEHHLAKVGVAGSNPVVRSMHGTAREKSRAVFYYWRRQNSDQ